MQTMLRMIGFGDNAGSGFPAILSAWKNEGWIKPELKEDIKLNQVTLALKMEPVWLIVWQTLTGNIVESIDDSKILAQEIDYIFKSSIESILIEKHVGMNGRIKALLERLMVYMINVLKDRIKKISETAKNLSDNISDDEELASIVQNFADGLKKSAESAETAEESADKLAESANNKICMEELSKRQKQVLDCMRQGKSYSTEEVAQIIGLKGPRTRQLLNELVAMDLISCMAATKNRRYVKST